MEMGNRTGNGNYTETGNGTGNVNGNEFISPLPYSFLEDVQ